MAETTARDRSVTFRIYEHRSNGVTCEIKIRKKWMRSRKQKQAISKINVETKKIPHQEHFRPFAPNRGIKIPMLKVTEALGGAGQGSYCLPTS